MNKLGCYLDKIIANLGYFGIGMGLVGLVWMMLMVSGNVMLRYFFNKPQLYVEEISGYCLIVIVFMGYAYTARQGAHVSVDLVTRHLSKKMADALDVVTSAIVLVLMSIYLWYDWRLFADYLQEGMRSRTSLATPLWIPISFICLGVLFVCFELVAHMVKKFRDFQKGASKEEGEISETPGAEPTKGGLLEVEI